ncbi:MAG TPA: sigma-70 family RNA polymerase sigma factor [Candidatus Limnocylindrales bacterium]|nr:sigma-70 family RNA polymerase sigma factor [Candidatus Limnocylindrales bacterium]
MERDTDADLLARLAAQPQAAFGDVVTTYGGLVFGVCLRVLREPATAEDIAQDALVNAYRALSSYPRERILALRLRPWLARIALNLARNSLRSHRTSTTLEGDFEPSAPSTDEPLSLAQRREERDMWARLLSELPERYRLAVALRHVDGLSYSELAEALGRPAGTVKSDVHRGLALLRAAYDAEQRRAARPRHRQAV